MPLELKESSYQKGLVSFCCLGYNHGKYIKSCIESIRLQNTKQIEIVVLDDGSSDNSKEVLEDLKEKSEVPMEVFFQDNSGNIAKNFNFLIAKANGEYVSLISLDDIFLGDIVSSAIKYFECDPNLVFVSNKYYRTIDENGTVIKRRKKILKGYVPKPISSNKLLELEYQKLGSFLIQGSLFRKKFISLVGGLDEDLLGDDIILRTKLLLYMVCDPKLNFKILNRVGVGYRYHSDNIHKNSLRQIQLIKEWKDRFFPERDCSEKIFSKIKSAYLKNHIEHNYKNMENIYLVLTDLLKNKDKKYREQKIAKLLLP